MALNRERKRRVHEAVSLWLQEVLRRSTLRSLFHFEAVLGEKKMSVDLLQNPRYLPWGRGRGRT